MLAYGPPDEHPALNVLFTFPDPMYDVASRLRWQKHGRRLGSWLNRVGVNVEVT